VRNFVAGSFVLVVAATPFLNSAAQQQPPVRTLTQDLRITADDVPAPEIVSGVAALSIGQDGMIFTADQREARVRMFDANGRFVRAFGSKGEGPGEFTGRFPSQFVGIRGDSVFIHENNRVGSVLLFRRNGTYLGMPLAERRSDRVIIAFLPGARSLVRIGHRPPGMIAPADSESFSIMDSLGNPVGTRLAVEKRQQGSILVPERAGAPRAGSFQQPFFHPIDGADDPAGLRAVVAAQWTTWGGQPGEVKLLFTTGTGNPIERIVKLEARRTTAALVNEWIRARLDALSAGLGRTGMSRAAAEAEIRKQLQIPEYFPAIEDMKLGNDGAVWLKMLGRPLGPLSTANPSEWTVVNPGGSIAYRVTVPGGVRVYQVSMDRMWGLMFDSDGLPVIVRYRVN
jgi:hypothetical protein